MAPAGALHAALSGWNFDLSLVAGLSLAAGGYALATGPLRKRLGITERVPAADQARFYLGLGVLFAALVSPLDHLADEYLFSAHMSQHLLLFMIFPLLFWAGVPAWLVERVLGLPGVRRAVTGLTALPVAFLIFNGVMLVWHIPRFYEATLESEGLHIFEHLTFIAAGLIGWWPVTGRFPKNLAQPSLAARLAYLFFMMLPSTGLGALITLARQPLIPFYVTAPRLTSLSALADQQLAGALMWFPANLVFIAAFSILFFKWFQAWPEEVYPPDDEHYPELGTKPYGKS